MPSPPFRCDTLAVVGVGLIGASVGLAAKARGVARHVIGVGTGRSSLETALARQAIDAVASLTDAARVADVIVVCTPVEHIADRVLAAAVVARPGTLITDAGSTKAEIVAAVEAKLPAEIAFVAGHPLAGAEKSGPAHARADLFAGRVCVLTPTEKTPDGDLERALSFWRSLGAIVQVISPADHDAALARTSHLPHVAAAALASVTPPELLDLTAGGWRDSTRIAGGSPGLWTGILLSNRPAVVAALGGLEDRLAAFRTAIAGGNAAELERLLTEAKKVRDALGTDAP